MEYCRSVRPTLHGKFIAFALRSNFLALRVKNEVFFGVLRVVSE
jgi:hypothetical protein